MKLLYAMAAWAAFSFVLGLGIYLLTIPNGSPWLLIISVLGFIIAVVKIGCKTD